MLLSRKYRFLVILLFALNFCLGQEFYKVLGTTGNDYANAVLNDRDSGFVIVGSTEGLGQGVTDGYMIKLDTGGVVKWTRTFGDQGVDRFADIVKLDDGFLICGVSEWNNDYLTYLVRTNWDGTLVYEKRIASSSWKFPTAMALYHDTVVLVGGNYYPVGSAVLDVFLEAFTLDGDPLWFKGFGGLEEDHLNQILVSDSSQIYWCGKYGVDSLDSDYWMMRVDELGNELWDLKLGDTLVDEAHGIVELVTGEFILTGADQVSAGTQVDNVFYKIDSLGNVLYQNTLNNAQDDYGIRVISYPGQNNFFLVSRSSSVGVGGLDTWIFECQYNTYGTGMNYDFGSGIDDFVNDADTTFDGGIVAVGNMLDGQLGNAIFINKVSATYNVIQTYTTDQDLAVSAFSKGELFFYPNPSSGMIYWNEDVSNEKYEIFNLEGKLLQSGVVNGNMLSLNLKEGFYVLRINGGIHRLVINH